MPFLHDDEISEFDALRVRVQDVSPGEQRALRARLMECVLESLAAIDTHQLQEVAQFIDLSSHDKGCETPAEAFFTGLLMRHYFFGGLTPDMVMEELDPENPDGFRFNFDDFRESMRRFNAAYSKREASVAAPILRSDATPAF